MNLSYALPRELIAQTPPERRDEARLLLLSKSTGEIKYLIFKDIINFLGKRHLLVLNNTKVFPARLFGFDKAGKKVEVLLVREKEPLVWEVLGKPSRRLRPGEVVSFNPSQNSPGMPPAAASPRDECKNVFSAQEEAPDGAKPPRKGGSPGNFTHGGFQASVLDNNSDRGYCLLKFTAYERGVKGFSDSMEFLDKYGHTPLPPYIKRPACEENDRARYQTVYASSSGSCACPTAGLHFTKEILSALAEKTAGLIEITLHIGPGTFKPVPEENIKNYKMEEESYFISEESAGVVNSAKKNGLSIVAVGTSTVRALEAAGSSGKVTAGKGDADIFICPGYKFRIVDSMFTNFHQPNSTPLAMVSAFAGSEYIMKAYREAIEAGYRFFSYGDAMFISA